ncbi:TAXI family TRAP transporter solute-binding subunit [Desulfohalovibrio reitneri]|uniref:TAXI family TRAP transporter solute-binding subunit n=1 Tax=Desulfohalovibrio reitneri TaxID=1307759 RepID=UPI0004A77A03|nr:TAXI family TRAP transporter solute-binding subunit [Desulfohalovibrio reitneri]
MTNGWKLFLLPLLALAVVAGFSPAPAKAKTYLAYGGGPVGGTFNYFANAMAIYISKNVPDVECSSEGSGGSGANLKRLNSHQVDYGIVYMGDAFLGRKGKLPQDTNNYTNVRAISFLYGAPGQLVVKAKSGITSTKQLEGKRVGVGNAGSGAATACERFFTHLGIWDKVDKQFLGYSAAASAFNDGKLDAFWVFAGYPTAAIIEAATRDDVRLINIGDDAEQSGFYDEYPFYTPVTIPAKTYTGQTEAVKSFQDSAYWCANKDVDPEIVYESVKTIYSEKGLAHMVAAKKTAKSMSIEDGLKGNAIPVHPGAVKFWEEHGHSIPDDLK